MEKLIGMTEYVKWVETQIVLINGSVRDLRTACQMMVKYANLISKPLKLGQFLPCNDKGEPMEEPQYLDSFDHTYEGKPKDGLLIKYEQESKEYQKAWL